MARTRVEHLTQRTKRIDKPPTRYVSPEQVRDIVARAAVPGTLPGVEVPLFDAIRGEVLFKYAQHYPRRVALIVEWLRAGSNATAAARELGILDRVARSWVAHFLDLASLRLHRIIERGADREILRSICSLTHGRADRLRGGGQCPYAPNSVPVVHESNNLLTRG